MWRLIFLGLLSIGVCDELQVAVPAVTRDGVSRIIGGTPAPIELYPYLVQVTYYNQLMCGGSILTRRIILSAAHCFVSDNVLASPTNFGIRAGTATLNNGGVTRSVSTIIVHESYNIPIRNNDIGLVVLSSLLTFSATIQPAYIPPQNYEPAANAIAIHAGWGRTIASVQSLSQILNHVTVNIVNRTVCANRYLDLQAATGFPYPVTTSMICAGLLDVGGADACQGDSGGPLVHSGVVVGIISWGNGCGEPYFPGVNARVSSYTNWINATVARYNSGPPMISCNVILLLISILFSLRYILEK